MDNRSSDTSVFRIDKFVVPSQARDEFLTAVRETQGFLEHQAGCLQNLVLEQISGPGMFNVVTMVEWRTQAEFEAAGEAMKAWRQATGFDSAALIKRLEIKPDMANYAVLAA